jgi:hypothetical protein
MPTPEAFFAIIVFSIIGLAAFRAGKREGAWKTMLIGVGLMVYPYFVSDAWWLWGIGVALTVGWFMVRE